MKNFFVLSLTVLVLMASSVAFAEGWTGQQTDCQPQISCGDCTGLQVINGDGSVVSPTMSCTSVDCDGNVSYFQANCSN